MAQTTGQTKSRKKTDSSRTGSKAKASNSTKSSAKRSSSKRAGSNGSRASSSSTRAKSSKRSTPQSRNGSRSIPETAVDKTKAAGQAVAGAASKAKVPLIAGGTALAGAAGGAALRSRAGASKSKNPLKRMGNLSMPKSASKLDLDTVKNAAERVSAYGQQASDIASAVEKTRKKNG